MSHRPPPPDLLLRAYAGEQDLSIVVRLFNAENEADGIPARHTVAGLRADYAIANEQFDPTRDVTIAEVRGEPVGVAISEWVDVNDENLREYELFGVVHPAWRRRGIGSALLEANERRARQLAQQHDTARGKIFGTFAGEHQTGARSIIEGAGYEAVRYFFDMLRPLREPILQATLPPGIEVRPVTPALYRQLWLAESDAFRDHWGGFDTSEEAFARWRNSPHFDPELFVVAFDGDEIAAGVINGIYPEENLELGVARGWLNGVFTRRAWRRRGLARALILRSFELLLSRGLDEAALGVDADNPSGALALYESVGFRVANRYTSYRKRM
jgi:mycothiol synthase